MFKDILLCSGCKLVEAFLGFGIALFFYGLLMGVKLIYCYYNTIICLLLAPLAIKFTGIKVFDFAAQLILVTRLFNRVNWKNHPRLSKIDLTKGSVMMQYHKLILRAYVPLLSH